MTDRTQLEVALRACELIVAVKHCMMFLRIHDDKSVREVLEKHGGDALNTLPLPERVQLLALKAEDVAGRALEMSSK